jgi:hypothetical protein
MTGNSGHEDDDDNDSEEPLAPESVQLLLPKASAANEDTAYDEDGDEEMSGGGGGSGGAAGHPAGFLKDGEILGELQAKEDEELLLHAVLAVADDEWESVDVVSTHPLTSSASPGIQRSG